MSLLVVVARVRLTRRELVFLLIGRCDVLPTRPSCVDRDGDLLLMGGRLSHVRACDWIETSRLLDVTFTLARIPPSRPLPVFVLRRVFTQR